MNLAPALTFINLLIYGTLVLTIVFSYLLSKGADGSGLRFVGRSKLLRWTHYSLLMALCVVTIWSIYLGSRPFIYFLIVTAIFLTSILYGVNLNEKDRSKILFLTALILAISVPTALIVGNHFYPRWHWENDIILQTGSFLKDQQSVSASGFYYYIPIDSLIKDSIALVMGPSQNVILIYYSSILVGIVAGLFALTRLLNRNSLIGFGIVGTFFFFSIPTLTLIGRLGGVFYTVFYVLFAFLLYRSRAAVVGILIIGLPMVFFHPAGFIAVILLLLPLAALNIKDWPSSGQNSRRVLISVLITTVIALTYWLYTYIIKLMTLSGRNLFLSIYSYFSGVTAQSESWYTPRYYLSGNEVFAYAWAVPAALSAALLLFTFFQYAKKKEFDRGQTHTVLTAFFGLFATMISYLSYQRGETGQYLIIVGYFLLLLSSSVIATRLLTKGRSKYAFTAAILLALVIPIGMSSPDWAPLENPNFEAAAKILPYHSYMEADGVNPIINSQSTIYYDYDFPISGGQYKLVRDVILQVSSGADPIQFARPPVTLFSIKEERFQMTSIPDWDIVYSSGYHRILAVQSSP